jgi:hypothetical protein
MAELVTVYTPRSEQERLFVVAVLSEFEIPYHCKGEYVQNLFGLGTLGSGFSLLTGPVEVQVAEKDRGRAAKAIQNVVLHRSPDPPDEAPATCPACSAATAGAHTCPDCGISL